MQVITGSDLKIMVSAAAESLHNERDRINALNVFPVPDGDTGTNMALTLKAALKELDSLEDAPIHRIAAAVARGSLMGARGNSGVILSQFFRGFSDGLAKIDQATGSDVARAFVQASETTYKAVMKPVEGTILTVGKAIADACTAAVTNGDHSAENVWQIGLDAGKVSLADTPNILPILKQAGVVDAGGEGLIVALEGALRAFRGEVPLLITGAEDEQERGKENNVVEVHNEGISRIEGKLVNKYCTEFLIKGTDLQVDHIRNSLESKGDSMLVVGESYLVKVHIHTDHPGQVLDFCGKLGDLDDIKIDNMKMQNENITLETDNVINFPSGIQNVEMEPPKAIGIVAVVPGQGLADIFVSLGVDKIVAGGQTMNPSTAELVKAVEGVNAEAVIILPNNKNVIFSAQQVNDLVDKKVEVVATRTIPQGIGGLMNFTDEEPLETNVTDMEKGVKQVKTGEVTYAVRSTIAGDLQIEEQDIIGLVEGKIAIAGQSVDQVSLDLLKTMVDEDSSIISIYAGDNRTQRESESFHSQVQTAFPDLDVELYQGGQPLYYYILSVE